MLDGRALFALSKPAVRMRGEEIAHAGCPSIATTLALFATF